MGPTNGRVEQSGGKWRIVFIGQYQHSIDGKGRVIMPARFRERLSDTFVVTRGLDECLFIYTMDRWHRLMGHMESLHFTRRDHRSFTRFFFSGASEGQLDSQGRFLVPPHLREYASLEKDLVIIGVSDRIEVWAAACWEAYSEEAAQSFEDIAEQLEGMEG